MKVTVRDIIDAHNALAAHGGLNLDPVLSMAFARMTRAIRHEAEIASEVRQGIVEKHAARDAENKPIPIILPNGMEDIKIADMPAYRAALKAWESAPVEIPGEPFKLASLGKEKINSDLLAGLHFAITD